MDRSLENRNSKWMRENVVRMDELLIAKINNGMEWNATQ